MSPGRRSVNSATPAGVHAANRAQTLSSRSGIIKSSQILLDILNDRRAAFDQGELDICRNVGPAIFAPAGPVDLQDLDGGRLADSHDLATIVRCAVAVSATNFEHLRGSRRGRANSGADGVAIGLDAVQQKNQTAAGGLSLVMQKGHRPVLMDDDQIGSAVAIEIEPRRAATQVLACEEFAAGAGNVGKAAFSLVVEQRSE